MRTTFVSAMGVWSERTQNDKVVYLDRTQKNVDSSNMPKLSVNHTPEKTWAKTRRDRRACDRNFENFFEYLG